MSAAPFGYGQVRASFTDVGLLIGRLTIGVVVFMHGWQKFAQLGYGGVVEMLTGVGAPVPQVSAALLILLEMVGSAAFVLGMFTRVVAVLMALNMAGAMLLLHLQNGFFVADDGYELVLMIGGAVLIYAFAGAGRLSVDAIFLLFFARRGKQATATATAEASEMLTGLKGETPKPGSPKPVAAAGSKPESRPEARPGSRPESKPATAEPAKTAASTTATGSTGGRQSAAPSPSPSRTEAPKPEVTKPDPARPGAATSGAPRSDAAKSEVPDAAASADAAKDDGPRHEAPTEAKPGDRSDALKADASRH